MNERRSFMHPRFPRRGLSKFVKRKHCHGLRMSRGRGYRVLFAARLGKQLSKKNPNLKLCFTTSALSAAFSGRASAARWVILVPAQVHKSIVPEIPVQSSRGIPAQVQKSIVPGIPGESSRGIPAQVQKSIVPEILGESSRGIQAQVRMSVVWS